MLYGGTSWGYLPAPVVATSYDYSAPISENRIIAAKYYETKLLALFLRSAKDLVKTERLGNNTGYTNNANIMTSELRNPDTNAAFYVTIHANSSLANPESFQLHVDTSVGALRIPQYAPETILDGHQSKIISTDFPVGKYSLLYTTAEVLSVAILDNITTIAFWVPTGESGEVSFKHLTTAKTVSCVGGSSIAFHAASGSIIMSFTQKVGMSVVNLDSGKLRVLLLDRSAAYKFWAPHLTANPLAPENQTGKFRSLFLLRMILLTWQ
jgi:beta-galactosidase